MQNKLYTIHFSHQHPMTDSQSVPKRRSQNPELVDFVNFTKLTKKLTNSQKSAKSWTREDLNSWKREELFYSLANINILPVLNPKHSSYWEEN